MTKASVGYRALALGEAEPHVVPLARFGGTAPSAPPAAERFNPFRDRQPAGAPAGTTRPLQETLAKAPPPAQESAPPKPAFLRNEAAQAPALAPEHHPAPAAEMSPWSRNEMLPASVLFEMGNFNEVLRFLVDRFVLEKRKGDVFVHVRSAAPAPGETQPVLSFIEPAKSALAADLLAALVAARRSAGHEISIVQPPEDHEDFDFWQRFARAVE